jgi:hypothetical protein
METKQEFYFGAVGVLGGYRLAYSGKCTNGKWIAEGDIYPEFSIADNIAREKSNERENYHYVSLR